ncbi:MAG: hypothetical protein NTZ13_01215 [Candidatus Parcubacteria bacterium]|nr:hypothetical protein [Candidatus Parcubacteria bacterium]
MMILTLVLFWLFVAFLLIGPFLIPWWISLHGGRWFFTALNPGTGAIRVLNGKLVEMHYTDKNGVAKTGSVTEGGTYDGVILPRGYTLVPCSEEGLTGKNEIKRINVNSDEVFSYLSFLRHYGIYFIGFPPSQRLQYRFAFSEFSKVKGKEGDVIRREEPTNFFYLARVEYALKAKDVEIGGNAIVDLHFSVFIRIVIPEIAIAENVDVIGQLSTILHTEATTFFRDIPYESLKQKFNEERFRKIIMKIKTKKTLGIVIEEVRLNEVSGQLSDILQKAYQATLVAEKEGDATILKAKKDGEAKVTASQAGVLVASKEAEAKNIRTDAERRRIKETYDEVEKHPDGVALRRLEALAEAGAGGNTIVFEGDSPMTKEAKKMLAITDRIRSKNTVKKEEV